MIKKEKNGKILANTSRGKSLLELRESNENLSDGLKNSTRITKAKCKFQTRGAKPRGAGIAFCLSDEGGIFQSMTKIFRWIHITIK